MSLSPSAASAWAFPFPDEDIGRESMPDRRPIGRSLPKREDQWGDQNALTVAPSVGAYSSTILSSEEAQERLKTASPESVPAQSRHSLSRPP